MGRFQETSSWLLSSLGLALMVCSLFLVPQNAAAQTLGGTCSGTATCDGSGMNRCTLSQDSGCDGDCSQTSNPTQCGSCKCAPFGGTQCICGS